MKPGIYHVTFASTLSGQQGDGLAIIKGNTINGGDMGYLYRGTFEVRGTATTAKLNVKRWNQSAVSVFGNIMQFDLQVEGQLSPDLTSFTGQGFVVQNPTMRLAFQAYRIEDAA
jgi:T3SS negative regulator,GrlR